MSAAAILFPCICPGCCFEHVDYDVVQAHERAEHPAWRAAFDEVCRRIAEEEGLLP